MIAEFVAFLEFSIFLALDLNGIVCEMDHAIHIFKIELMRAGPDVAQRKPIVLALASYKEAKHEGPYIKLTTLIKKQIRLVSLNDSCTSSF